MANRLFVSQLSYSFEKQIVELVGSFTLDSESTAASLVDQDITYTALEEGETGNDISIELIDPSAPSEPLAINVIGNAISVSLETDSGSAIVTDADALVAALQGDGAVTALIDVAGSGATPLVALTQTFLSGGADAVFSNNLPLPIMSLERMGEGLYQIMLADRYLDLLSLDISLMLASDNLLAIPSAEDVDGDRSINFRIVDLSGALSDLPEGDTILLDIKLRNVR